MIGLAVIFNVPLFLVIVKLLDTSVSPAFLIVTLLKVFVAEPTPAPTEPLQLNVAV